MKPAQNSRRSRGRNNSKSSSNRRGNESNRGDSRPRGNLVQLLEKYKTLARDALSSGDRVHAENYLQHADHYQRILNERNAQRNQQEQDANQRSRRRRAEEHEAETRDPSQRADADATPNASEDATSEALSQDMADHTDTAENKDEAVTSESVEAPRRSSSRRSSAGNGRGRQRRPANGHDASGGHEVAVAETSDEEPMLAVEKEQEAPPEAVSASEPEGEVPAKPRRGRPRRKKVETVATDVGTES
ncbi:MAG: DUF4167 domain-containing protein [Pseudomonadota bacterium]